MHWYNQIRFDIKSEVAPMFEDGPLRPVNCMKFRVMLDVVWSITDGIRVDTWRKLTYRGEHPNSLDALKEAFQEFLDKQIYNIQTDYDRGYKERFRDCPSDFTKLPLEINLDNHNPEMQEFIRQIIYGTGQQNVFGVFGFIERG